MYLLGILFIPSKTESEGLLSPSSFSNYFSFFSTKWDNKYACVSKKHDCDFQI